MERIEIILGEDETPGRADRVIALRLPQLAAWQLRAAFRRRDVKRNGQRIQADTVVSPGDVLHLFVERKPGPALHIVFEDGAYVIVNKQQGMPTQGEGSVEALYQRQTGRPALACHRLDVQTGGLLLLAKEETSRLLAERAFAERTVFKTYEAIVRGHPLPPEATLRAFLRKDARAARVRVLDRPQSGTLPIETRYRTLGHQADTTRLSIDLITGRTHQIRAHLAHIGHPVLGDDKYGDRAFNRAHGVRRQKLWAVRLALWDGRVFTVKPDF